MSTSLVPPPRPRSIAPCLAWLLLAVLVLAPALARHASAQDVAQPSPATAQRELPEPPAVSAAAAFVVDASAETPLYALNPDERRPPASLVKMMTAVVAREHAGLDEQVEVVEADQVDIDQFSHMGLVAGDTLTVDQLLHGLLVPSGNDAARALARHVGGKLSGESDPSAAVAAFVAAMNERAAALGMTNTRFVNPSGEDAADQYASARDLATLATTLMADDKLREIVDLPQYQTTSVGEEQRAYGDGGILYNTNSLLADEGVHGVKTGTTAEAGGNLVTATYFLGGNRVIVVLLGSPYEVGEDGLPITDERYPATVDILNQLPNDYRWFDPGIPGALPDLDAEMAAWEVAMRQGTAVVVPLARLEELRYSLRLGPPGEPNDEVGKVLFFVGDDPLGERPVYQT